MAIIGMEGFDYFETSNGPSLEVNQKENYTIEYPLEKSIRLKNGGRFGTGKFLRLKQNDDFIVNVGDTSITRTITISFALRPRTQISGTGLLYINDIDGDGRHAFLRLTNSGTIRAKTGASGSVAISSQSLNINTWYWVEVRVYSANVVGGGYIKVDVNGESWIDTTVDPGTGIDTRVTATNIGSFAFQAGATDFDIDDLVWQDSATLLGDSRIELLKPNGSTDDSWSNTGGGPDWVDVSVITDPNATPTPLDVFADWIFTAVPDRQDFSYDSISSDSIVRALSVEYLARRDDVQSRSVEGNTTANAQSGTARALGTSWMWYQDIFQYYNPTGSVAWTQSNINESGFGIEDVTP